MKIFRTEMMNWASYTEYISEDGTMGRQVWFDGYEEIYEIEK